MLAVIIDFFYYYCNITQTKLKPSSGL